MSPVLQRLQRRAVVALAWLMLALSVAPAAAEPLRTATVYAAAASSLSLGAAGPGAGRAARDIAADSGARLARGQRTQSVERVTLTRRAPRALDRARAASLAAALPVPVGGRCEARDGRHLYLSICRLSC
jgi:hypothetical protein